MIEYISYWILTIVVLVASIGLIPISIDLYKDGTICMVVLLLIVVVLAWIIKEAVKFAIWLLRY